jgi:hypothetical protein
MSASHPPEQSIVPAIDGAASAAASNAPLGGDVSADIQAEIADHLALAATALEIAGADAHTATQQAVTRFGDVQQIARKCWWVQQGDQVMRRALWIVGGVLVVAIAASFIFPASANLRQLRDSVDLLTEELAALRQAQLDQQALLSRKPPRYEIRGRAVLGSRDKPAAAIPIDIWNIDAGEVARRIATDADGRFVSGLLAPGVYSVVAPLSGPGNFQVEIRDRAERIVNNPPPSRAGAYFAVQSEPVYIGDGNVPDEILLDVRMQRGEIGFLTSHLVKQLPHRVHVDTLENAVTLQLRFSAKPLSLDAIPYHVLSRPPANWPATGFRAGWLRDLVLSPVDLTDKREIRFARFWLPDITPGMTGQRDVNADRPSSVIRPPIPPDADYITLPESMLPPGEYQVGVALLPEFRAANVAPKDVERMAAANLAQTIHHGMALVHDGEMPGQTLLTVRVEDGRRTRVRVVVPPDLADLLTEMRGELAKPIPPSPEAFGLNSEQDRQFKAWAQAFRPRPLKIELAGSTAATGAGK